MAETTDAAAAGPTLSMEAILERLGRVVDHLERGDLPLEDALRMFEEGVRLTREGQTRLDAAERRIEMLLAPETQQGEPVLQPMTTARG